jgi:hypothetical protein
MGDAFPSSEPQELQRAYAVLGKAIFEAKPRGVNFADEMAFLDTCVARRKALAADDAVGKKHLNKDVWVGCVALGKAAFAKHGLNAGPSALTEQVAALQATSVAAAPECPILPSLTTPDYEPVKREGGTAYLLPSTSVDLRQIVTAIEANLRSQGYQVETQSGAGCRYSMQVKKSSGLRDFTGMALSFKVQLSLPETSDGICCEIAHDANTDSLVKAGVAGLFTGGVTWATAGVGVAKARQAEEGVVSFLENLLSCKRAGVSVGTASSISSADIAETAKAAGSLLLKAARAVAKSTSATGVAIANAFRKKCPECKEPTVEETSVRLLEEKQEVRGAVRDRQTGQIRERRPLIVPQEDKYRYEQTQAVYRVRLYLHGYVCKSCAHTWTEQRGNAEIA